jgi:hypothetical protein
MGAFYDSASFDHTSDATLNLSSVFGATLCWCHGITRILSRYTKEDLDLFSFELTDAEVEQINGFKA